MISAIRSAAQRSLRTTFRLCTAALLLATPAAFAGVTATPSVPILSFPATAVGTTTAVTATVTFSITGYNSYPGITYHYGTDYTTSAETCDGASPTETCTLTVKFKPTVPGARKDAIFVSYSGARIATVLLSGTGTAPLSAIQPGVATTILTSGVAGMLAPVMDENGTLYFYSQGTFGIYKCPTGCTAPTLIVPNAENIGSFVSMGIDGAGVLYYGQTVSTAGPSTTINTYDTVQNIAGTITMPASDIYIGTAVDAVGDIFALGKNIQSVVKITPSGATTTTALNPAVSNSQLIATDPSGNVFVGSIAGGGINEITTAGTQTQVTTHTPVTALAFDAGSTLYSADGTSTEFPIESPSSNYNSISYSFSPLVTTGIVVVPGGSLVFAGNNSRTIIDRSHGAVAFGNVPSGSTATTQVLNVLNAGNQPLTYTNIAISGAGFALQTASTNPCTGGIVLAAGASCNLAVNFTSPHPGSYTGSITLISNSLNNAATTQTITLAAQTVGAYLTLSPSSLAFQPQVQGTTSPTQNLTVTNNGYQTAAPLASAAASYSGNSTFAIDQGTCTGSLAAGSSCVLTVTFSPYAPGSYSTTITANGGTGVAVAAGIPAAGSGTPVVTQTGGGTNNSLIFNNAAVGIAPGSAQTLTATFTLTGYTTQPTSTTAAMHYGTSFTAGTLVCTGGPAVLACSIPVTFVPQYPGGRRDAIMVSVNGVQAAILQVYGVGTAPLALIQPGVITYPIHNTGGYYYDSVVGEDGTAYVLGSNSNSTYSITRAGVVTMLPIAYGSAQPQGVAVDGAGTLYITLGDYSNNIITYTAAGVQSSVPWKFPTGYTPCSNLSGFYGINAGIAGDLYTFENVCNILYSAKRDGTGTATSVNPSITQPTQIATDSVEDVFISGYSINEVPASGTQTQITAYGSTDGIGIDAANTLYIGRYNNNTVSYPIGMIPASNYNGPIAGLDSGGAITGNPSVAPDGTVYIGDYTSVDKIDRSQGLFTFNAVNANQAATPQIATLYNGGNTPLTLTSMTLTGDPNYLISANGCTNGLVIPVGGVCTVTVNFTSPHNGIFTGALTYVTNSLNTTTTQTVGLTDTVAGPYLTANQTTLNFGTVPLNTPSAPQTITVTNNGGIAANISAGDNNGRFAITVPSSCTNVAIGASCTISVVLTPTASGPISTTGNITATSMGGVNSNAIPLTLNGTGGAAPAPIATLSATSLTFNPPIGTTSPTQVVQLTNTGNAPLILTTLGNSGNNSFALVPTLTTNPCTSTTTLIAGASCNIAVNFTTYSYYSPGPYTSSIGIYDNAGTGNQTIALSGTYTTTPQLQFTPTQVTAIAGTGALTSSGTGDNGPALSATFSQLFAVAQDPSGNIYVVDYGANYVRKIAPNGTITQFAGQVGYINHGFSGDGGPAINAQFNQPDGIAIDQAGNVYIADELNGRVRVVNAATGIISTYAGSGVGTYVNGASASAAKFPGPVGLTFDPSGNLYIAMGQNSPLVVEVTPAGATSTFAGGNGSGYNGDNILATAAQLSQPFSVASDQSGNIYIADNGNSRVRKVIASTGKITTVAGNGTVSSTGDGGAASSATVIPYNVAVNLAGDVFIEGGTSSNLTSFSVRKITANGAGSISTVAGGGAGGLGGPATSANFNQLEGIAIDNNGSLLITTYGPGTSQILSAGPAGFLQFPNTVVAATSAAQVITIENTGNANLTLPNGSYTATGPFTITGGSCLQANTVLGTGSYGGCNISVTFTPTAATTQTGTITVASNGSIPSQTIYLQGTGTPGSAPAVTISPSSLTFSATVNSTSATQNVTITNTGTATLTGPSATILGTNGFYFNTQSTSCTGSLAVNASCVVSVNFSPSLTTTVTASLSFADNATGSPQSIPLSGTGTAAPTPSATLSPTGLTFTATTSTVAYNQAIALSNTGTATLNISSVALTGTNATAFALLTAPSSPCGSTLAAGATCNLYVSLTANTVGTYSANVVVTDNASPTTQTATLAGTVSGVGLASFSPTSLNFPSTLTNSTATAMTLVLTNTGTAAITGIGAVTLTGSGSSAFAQTNNCGTTLAVGGTCTVSVTFTPSSATLFAATVSVTDSVGTQSASIAGTGTAPTPQAALTGALGFPSTVINTTSSAMTATLNNAGGAALPITSAVVSGPFAIAANTCGSSLGAGASCTYSITFTPTATGTQTGTLTVADSVGTQATMLTGTGAAAPAPQAALTAALAFPSTVINTTATPMTATLTNAGTAALPITSAIASSQFAISANTCGTSLAAGASCSYSITFTPTATGAQTGTLTVVDSVGTQTTALTGTGAAVPVAQAVLSPTSFTFASTFQGTPSAVQVFTLSNPGSATLSAIAISFTGANPAVFAQTTTCGATLAAAATCNISVVFTPATAATYTANLSVASNVATASSALTGVGNSSTGFTVVASTPNQTVDPGQAAVFNINVNTLTGNYTLPVTLTASGLPPGATYSFSPATVVPGTTGAPTVLTIQTSASVAGLSPASLKPLRGLPILAVLVLLPFTGLRRMRRKLSPALRLLSLVLISLAALLPLSGCGGGGYFGQGPQAFTITVTGTSSAATQSTTVTLNLQ